MKFGILLVCLFVTTCQGKYDDLPPVDPTTHQQIKQLVEQKKGRVVLVNVWATWCEPCREEMPALVKLYRKFRDKGFELVLVSTDDVELVRTKVQPMLKDFGVDFPTYINTGNDEAFITGMSSEWNGALPTSFLYDKNGSLANILTGSRTHEQFEQAIRKLLAS